MHRFSIFLFAGLVAQATISGAEDKPKPALTKATYSITGLHCPPCTRTVETSLKKIKGVQSAKVDWSTKTAKIEFNENLLSAQKLAKAIAGTPHMMGGGMHYGGWLALKVPDMKDKAAAKKVKDALEKQAGVKRVATYPASHAVNIEFGPDGSATAQELITAIAGAGLTATNY